MGGVDKNDQLEGVYTMCRASRKMWKKLAFYFVGLALINGLVVYRKLYPTKYAIERSGHKQFRLAIIDQLLSANRPATPLYRLPKLDQPGDPRGHHHTIKCVPIHELKRRVVQPTEEEEKGKKQVCKYERHSCSYKSCKARTIYRCIPCAKPLCFPACYNSYHIELYETYGVVDEEVQMTDSTTDDELAIVGEPVEARKTRSAMKRRASPSVSPKPRKSRRLLGPFE